MTKPVFPCLLFAATFAFSSIAQTSDPASERLEDSEKVLEAEKAPAMSLDDVLKQATDEKLNASTDVASTSTQRQNEAPGTVTLITRKEIQASGARNLIDLLHLVAGFSFGSDVQGGVGPFFRGIWGFEGKVLILWDGFQINELLFYTVQIENRFPMDSIDKIEIVRGPGSALYGGFAELAVVRISTRGAKVQGVEANLQYGQLMTGFGRATANLQYGQTFGSGDDALDVSANLYIGETTRSDAFYDDGYGNTVQMGYQNSRQSPKFFSARVGYKGFSLTGMLDLHRQIQQDQYGTLLDSPNGNHFQTGQARLQYDRAISNTLKASAFVSFLRGNAFNTGDIFGQPNKDVELSFDTTFNRYRTQGLLQWAFAKGLSLDVGAEGYIDQGFAYADENGEYFGDNGPWSTGGDVLSLFNGGAFAQLTWLSKIVNLTAGARAEVNSVGGPSLVPRLALSRDFGPFYVKALVNGAFRPPSLINYDRNADIKSELTYAGEVEIGADVFKGVLLTANAFAIRVNRPIVYFYNEEFDVGQYLNYDNIGSVGAELEARVVQPWGTGHATYSFSTNAGQNTVEVYGTNLELLRGVPSHKFTTLAAVNVTDKLTLSPSFFILGPRAGWLGAENNETEMTPPVYMLNFSVAYRDFFVDGLDISGSVFNILDQDYRYIQAYDGGHVPLPSTSREFLVKLTYHFSLKN